MNNSIVLLASLSLALLFTSSAFAQSVGAESPEVTVPATCTVSSCSTSTTTDAVYAPYMPYKCYVPLGGACVWGFGLAPNVIVPGQNVPAICTSALSGICRAPTTILPKGYLAVTATVYEPWIDTTHEPKPFGGVPVIFGPVEMRFCEGCPIYDVPKNFLFVGFGTTVKVGPNTVNPGLNLLV